jgi:hypothetical protein
MPLPPRVVSAWLRDVAAASSDETSQRRKLPQVQEAQSQPRKRRALGKTTANMSRPQPSPPDSPDPLNIIEQPSERARERSGQAKSGKANVGSQQKAEKVKRPRGRPRKPKEKEPEPIAGLRSLGATGALVLSPSMSQDLDSPYEEELELPMRYVASIPVSSTATASTSRRGRSRNASPVKNMNHMEVFDKPVSVGFVNEKRPIPEVLQPHWDALEDICANIGIIPRSVQVGQLIGNVMIIVTVCRPRSKKWSDYILLCCP